MSHIVVIANTYESVGDYCVELQESGNDVDIFRVLPDTVEKEISGPYYDKLSIEAYGADEVHSTSYELANRFKHGIYGFFMIPRDMVKVVQPSVSEVKIGGVK